MARFAGPATSMRRGVSESLVGKAAELVTLAALAVVVPRVLGADAYGRFSVPLTLVTLGSLAMTLGGPTLMARYVPAAPADERVALAKAIGARLARGRGLQVVAVVGVACVLTVVDGAAFPRLATALVVAALAANVAATIILQVGLGLGHSAAWSLRYPVQNAVLIVAVLWLHQVAPELGGVVAIVVAALAGLVFAWWAMGPTIRRPTPAVAVPPGAIRFGVHQALGAGLVQYCQRGGVLAVALLGASTVEVGYVALASGIAIGVTYAVLQAFTVSLTHLADRDDVASAEASLRRLAGGLLAGLVPLALVAALVADELIPRVFGSDYSNAVDAFIPAIALVVLAPLYALTVQAAALRLRPEAAAISGAAAAATFTVVALLAVPTWGAVGGTAASLAGASVGSVVAMLLLRGAAGAWLGAASVGGVASIVAVGVVAT